MDSDRLLSVWAEVVKAQYEVNKSQLALLEANDEQLKATDKQLTERLGDLENSIAEHSKRSQSNFHYQSWLSFVIFAGFFLLVILGTTVEGQLGGNKITYSSDPIIRLLLSALSVCGGTAAISRIPAIKKLFKNG